MAETGASKRALVLVTGLFFLWGVANNLNDILIPHFRSVFQLNDLQSGLVQSAFYLGYFCFAIPASLTMIRFGYKGAVITGLALFACGAALFWPAALAISYPLFLLALFVIASGLAFLETSANPMIASLGPPEDAERRLNFAQSFNPLGSITGLTMGTYLILPAAAGGGPEAVRNVLIPYSIIALVVLLWAFLLAGTRFPAVVTEEREAHPLSDFGALLSRPLYLFGVLAQFAYVGAQVGVWSFTIRYVGSALPHLSQRDAAKLVIVSLVLFILGRFIGTALLTRVRGAPLMMVYGLIGAVLCLIGAVVGGAIGVGALVATSFFMSIMFPTIFVLALRGLGPLTKSGAAMIVMAIIGGAAFTALMGLISDQTHSIANAMLVPAACFGIVALFAATHLRDRFAQ
jgi:FHS family L-fucose permease-like MFS transporter